ncbi:COP1-interacting protein 7 [Castilleja foliolosa]|uniref:COP1-interacting protein 7 n=1 Tax=Castilleja foliolosa TaxID=1961234 RepID=A0ABD3DDF3_9LAMI
MDPKTLLDYALFQLTPTRTRCDLVIFGGKKNEKLASGLLEPFVSHLKSAKDQISKGGYSITLRPTSSDDHSWFTKATLDRFVRFVSTPEVLERFVTIEREINQIESSFESNLELQGTPSANDGNYKSKGQSSDTEAEEKPKVRLQRVLETRLSMLKKEQAMAYARALVAGFEMDYLYDLVSFSDAFGAHRLREACVNFMELCNKKNDDKIWMDEVAAMKASYLGASGNVILSAENIVPISGSISRHGSMDTSEGTESGLPTEFNQQQQTEGAAQLSNPWPHHHPSYMQSSQAPPMYQPYPGYMLPGMQVGPSQYPANMPWPANIHESDKDSWRHKSHKKKEKKHVNKKNEEIIETDRSSFESDSSDEQDEQINNKKHNKNRSRKVVIRNINYIAPSKNENSNDSDSYSSDEDEHVRSSKRHHKPNHNKKASGKPKNSLDAENENVPNPEEGKKDGNWDIFQNLLMRDPGSNLNDTSSKSIPDHRDENSYSLDAKSKYTSDDLLFTDKSTGNGFGETDLKFEAGENFHGVVKRQNDDEFLILPRQKEENYQTSHFSTEPSIFIPVGGNTKDIISDDSAMMVQSRIPDSQQQNQPRDDIFMVTDIVEANNQSKNDILPGYSHFYEPEDLKMMLGNNSVTEQGVTSWSHDMENDNILAVETVGKRIIAEPNGDSVDDNAKRTRNGKTSKTGASARKVGSGKESKPKAPIGSLGRSKSDIPPRSKISTSGSAMSRSKSEKEEEKRKRMEELVMQRQKRIAERSAAKGVTPETTSKRSSIESKKTNSVSTKTNQLRAPADESKKPNKPVMRSSTLDRLAAARKTNKPTPPTEQKLVQNKKPTPNGKSVKSTPLLKKANVIKKNVMGKKINPEKPEKTQVKKGDVNEGSGRVEVLLHEANTDKKESVVPVVLDNVNDGQVEVTPEITFNPTGGNDLKSNVLNIDEIKGGEKKKLTFSPEISVVEISTPPPDDETNEEQNHSRKKWNDGESSPKMPKGFRRLLLFGRRT